MAKKILALVLTVMMIAALSVSAFADDVQEGNTDGSVTISNAKKGEGYTLYKIFDLTYSFIGDATEEDGQNEQIEPTPAENTNVSYTFKKTDDTAAQYAALTASGSPFVLTPEANHTAGDNCTYNVALADESTTGETIGNWLKKNSAALGTAIKTETATGETVAFTDLGYGYYYVETTQGTLVTVNSTLKDVTVIDKNLQPTIDKYVWEKWTFNSDGTLNETPATEWVLNSDGSVAPNTGWGASNDASLQDVVYFTNVIHAVAGAKDYKLTDTLGDGFESFGLIGVKDNDGALTSGQDFTLSTEGNTFTITFSDTYLDKYYNNQIAATSDGRAAVMKDIAVSYKAVVDDDAVIAGAGNPNNVVLSWGSDGNLETTTNASTTTKVWQFDTKKVDTNGVTLADADFVLYSDAACTKAMPLTEVTPNTVFRYDRENGTITGSDGTLTYITTNSDGIFNIFGLDAGTYYLKEVDSPAGYKLMEEPVEIVIGHDGSFTPNSDGYVTIENSTGKELPATGGIGTTIFYVVGSICVVGAAVLLLSKKRVRG